MLALSQGYRTSRHGLRTIAEILHGFVQICLALANITCDGKAVYSFTTQRKTAVRTESQLTFSTGVHLETFLEALTFLSQRKHWLLHGE